MDLERLDALIRSPSSRRAAFRGGFLAALGLLNITPGVQAATCPRGKKPCKNTCIPKKACCTNASCRPAVTGKVCRKRRCVCPPARPRRCGGRCVPRNGCCNDNECNSRTTGRICRAGKCQCPGTQRLCGNRCVPRAVCCAVKDCGPGQICLSNQSCAIPATTSDDCPGTCILRLSAEGPQYCSRLSGTCNNPCTSDKTCPRGTACFSCGPTGTHCLALCTG